MSSDTITLIIVTGLALLLVVAQPVRFFDGDEWTLYFVTRHFSQGQYSIDQSQIEAQRAQAVRIKDRFGPNIGGLGLGSYRQRQDGRYVLEKSPGYFVVLGQFARFGLERYFNFLCALSLMILLIHLGRLWFTPAHTRTILWLVIFSPAALIMLYRPYMESFASYALLGMGGVAYLIADTVFHDEQASRRRYFWWLGLAGFCLGFALFVRMALLPTILLFVLHFVYRIVRNLGKPNKGHLLRGLVVLLAGLILFGSAIMLYNDHVNGSPLTPGYALGKPKQSIYCFSFQRLLHQEPVRPFAIIVRNIIRMPELLLNGYPLLLFALAGLPLGYTMLRRDLFWLLFLWIASIYLLYLQFLVFNDRHFMVIGRLYLPAMTPLAIFAGYALEKLGSTPRRIALCCLVCLALISYFYFLCQIGVDPFEWGILETFNLKNWINYR